MTFCLPNFFRGKIAEKFLKLAAYRYLWPPIFSMATDQNGCQQKNDLKLITSELKTYIKIWNSTN